MDHRPNQYSVCLVLLVAATAMAHPAVAGTAAAPQSESVTLKGEIIDPQCYFTHGSRGAAHASCAAMCAKGGQGLAFLDDASGTVYPLIARAHGASQNEGLLPHLGKPVVVKGVSYRKGRNVVLLIQSVVDRPAGSK
jgi:predicted lipoprotein with Yx(FWY)xxD motif